MKDNFAIVFADKRDEKRMHGGDVYICTDRWGTCIHDHAHPFTYVRVPVLFSELVAGDPTMDGVPR